MLLFCSGRIAVLQSARGAHRSSALHRERTLLFPSADVLVVLVVEYFVFCVFCLRNSYGLELAWQFLVLPCDLHFATAGTFGLPCSDLRLVRYFWSLQVMTFRFFSCSCRVISCSALVKSMDVAFLVLSSRWVCAFTNVPVTYNVCRCDSRYCEMFPFRVQRHFGRYVRAFPNPCKVLVTHVFARTLHFLFRAGAT